MAFEKLVPWRRSIPAISSADPFTSLSSLQNEMNRMFNNIWSSPDLPTPMSSLSDETTGIFYPDVEMSETDGHIEVSAELPGVTEKDIAVTLTPDGNTLSIKGEKRTSKEKKEKDYYCAERSYGSSRRTMSLPATVNADKVKAKLRDGVLEVTLEKMEPSSKGVKHIQINQ